MIIELYILLQIIATGVFLLAWFGKNPIMWGTSVILFGIQMIAGFNIEYNVMVVSDLSVTLSTIGFSSLFAYVNMIFFSLCLVMFFYDIFTDR